MNLLSRLKLRTKLVLLLGLSALATVACIGVGASLLHQRMEADRVDKLRAVVQSVASVAKMLEGQVAAGKLTHDQALLALRDDIHAIRFDDGTGYVVLQASDGKILAHGANPSLDGTPGNAADANGRSIAQLLSQALQSADEASISYLFPKPGKTQPQQKLSYVARFAPWQATLLAGAYTDDLEDDFRASLLQLIGIGSFILFATLVLAWLVNRDVTRPLAGLRHAMERLAAGDLTTAIPGTARHDEVGGMAGAVLVFRDHMVAERQLVADQESERQRAEATKRAALVDMAEAIEKETNAALQVVGGRTEAMAATAEAMCSSASRTDRSAQDAAGAASQALANAQTVASAAEQLAASIREIGAQVTQSTEVVGKAVTAGRETRATIEALNGEVERIGLVADMISEIAAKTNLLALNATIEAARAGDAGKGFAVVASEVKQLATQTARSTEEITRHITEVRSATSASVAAVGRIEQTITEINAIAGSIAAAVEEQGAATAEIARNVTETAAAANEMTARTAEVSTEAKDTGERSADVLQHTAVLNGAVGDLKHAVIRVVRTSTAEVDRRTTVRHVVDLPCRLSLAGQAAQPARLADISEAGACVRGVTAPSLGAAGTLDVDGVGFQLPCSVCSIDTHGGVHMAFRLDADTSTRWRAALDRLMQRRAA